MKYIARLLDAVVFIVLWIAGIVLANGIWSTLGAIVMPFYAWYLVIEKALLMSGWIE